MNKRQRKKLLKQQALELQQVSEVEVVKHRARDQVKTKKRTRSRAIARLKAEEHLSNDVLGEFIQRKRNTLNTSVKRFDKLIDDYIEEQVEIRRETIKREREKVLEVDLPPYIDFEAEMNNLGYALRKGQLKVVPDLDFMANEYFQWWERTFYGIVEGSGFRREGLYKMLERMAFDVRDIAIQTFIERQHEDPRNICAGAWHILEREIAEYGERYEEEKNKVYSLTNKPNATGRREK